MNTVVGHAQTRQLLEALRTAERIPHALLFVGPSGVGKFLTARTFGAQLLLDRLREPAQHTSAEHLARTAQLPDLHVLEVEDGKKEIAVDQVRELIASLSLKPYLSSRTVAVIDEAEKMSTAAANALLKTLEEPSSETFLILVTAHPHRLPDTILSRCQPVQFSKLSVEDLVQILESFGLSRDLSQSLANVADGELTELNLLPFLDPKTRTVAESEKMGSALSKRASEILELHSEFDRIFTGHQDDYGAVLSLASQISAETERERYWQALRTWGRQRMLRAQEPDARARAEQLLQILSAELSVKERNANLTLTLSSLFLGLHSSNLNSNLNARASRPTSPTH